MLVKQCVILLCMHSNQVSKEHLLIDRQDYKVTVSCILFLFVQVQLLKGQETAILFSILVLCFINELNDCIRNATAVCNPRQNSLRDTFSLRQISV